MSLLVVFVVSSVINKSPVFISCPVFIFILFTTPSISDGISIDALSDSNTTIVSSLFIFCSLEIGISLTVVDSIPSPRSGKCMFFVFFILYCCWVWFFWINVIFLHGLFNFCHFYKPFVCQGP